MLSSSGEAAEEWQPLFFSDCFTLKTETINVPLKCLRADSRMTQNLIPDDMNLQHHHHVNLKSQCHVSLKADYCSYLWFTSEMSGTDSSNLHLQIPKPLTLHTAHCVTFCHNSQDCNSVWNVWFQVSIVKQIRTALCRAIMQQGVVIPNRSLRTTCRSHLQRSESKMLLRNYHYSLCNNPQQDSSHTALRYFALLQRIHKGSGTQAPSN